MIRFSNSFRIRSLQDTLALEQFYSEKYGISSIANITHLHNIGIPVFAGNRPNAPLGSRSVNYGKGFKEDEARVSAFMESLEYALADRYCNSIEIENVPLDHVLDGQERENAILDFCPILGTEFHVDIKIESIRAKDLLSEKEFYVPAELVFIPYNAASKQFGNSSNGLCSGNSLEEATIHGIIELIERDITSQQIVRPNAQLVRDKSLEDEARILSDQVTNAGHELIVHYVENEFQMPYFEAIIIDKNLEKPVEVRVGYGCHPIKQIAITRAITEAAQERIGALFLAAKEEGSAPFFFNDLKRHGKATMKSQISLEFKGKIPSTNFGEIAEHRWCNNGIAGLYENMIRLITSRSLDYVFVIPFTHTSEKLQVAKVIIPKLEYYNMHTKRVGPRLAGFVEHFAKT